MENKKVAIFGASGYIGMRLAHRFTKISHIEQVLFNRNKAKLIHLKNDKNTKLVDYPLEERNFDKLVEDLKDVDYVYYLIHSMYEEKDFSNIDNVLASLVAKAATKVSVEKIIYLGGLGTDEGELSKHLSSRQQTGDYLRKYHNNIIEFRAGIILGGGSSSFEIVRSLGNKLPFIPLLWKNEGLVEPIFVDNVINYLLLSKKDSDFDNKILEIGCGEPIKYSNLVKMYATKVKNRNISIINIPLIQDKLSDRFLGRLIAFMTALPPALVTPLMGGVKNKAICDKHKVDDIIGKKTIKPLKLLQSLRTASKREDQGKVLSIWDYPSNHSHLRKGEEEILFSNLYEIEGMLYEEFSLEIPKNMSVEKVFDEIKKIGGTHGYWSMNWAWKIRGFIDRLIGGIGFNEFRRNPTELRVGDRIDFWTVDKYIDVVDYKKLRLSAEMKSPGEAWLQFKIQDRKLILNAFFDPDGISGYFYWYSLFIIHKIIFKNMTKNILKNVNKEK